MKSNADPSERPRNPQLIAAAERQEVWVTRREEIGAWVRFAETEGVRLRAVGSRRSSLSADDAGLILRTDGLKGICALPPHLSHREDLVQVRAGTLVSELTDALAERGRALENHAAWTGQTIAGALATASHGTGLSLAPMCDLVVSVVLVTGGGRAVRVEPRRSASPHAAIEPGVERILDDDIFHSAVVGMGSFGVVTDVVLRTCESTWLEEFREARSWSEVKAEIEAGDLDRFPYWQVLVNPYETSGRHTCIVTKRRPVRVAPGTRPDRRQRWLPLLFAKHGLDRWLCRQMNAFPNTIPRLIERALLATERSPIRGPMHQILDNRPLNTCAEAFAFEGGVPAEQGTLAVERVMSLAREQAALGRWLSAPISLRFCASSEHLLAPQHGRKTAMVEVIALKRARWPRELLSPFAHAVGGRPHWGLDVFTVEGADCVRAHWEATDRFLAARERLDPGAAFDTPFTDLFRSRISTSRGASPRSLSWHTFSGPVEARESVW